MNGHGRHYLSISCSRRCSSALRPDSSSFSSITIDSESARVDGSGSSVWVVLDSRGRSVVAGGGHDSATWPRPGRLLPGIALAAARLVCWRLAGGDAGSGLERSNDDDALSADTIITSSALATRTPCRPIIRWRIVTVNSYKTVESR